MNRSIFSEETEEVIKPRARGKAAPEEGEEPAAKPKAKSRGAVADRRIPAESISFGTDGWRGLIARDFTFDNVRRAADALARVLAPKSRVAVGWDNRFLSAEFARTAARALEGRGHKVILFDGPTTSPALSLSLKALRAKAGVMITASHNPPTYNGFKVKLPPGRSADPAFTTRLEALLEKDVPRLPAPEAFEAYEPGAPYVEFLLGHLDRRWWSRARKPVLIDAMHGTGAAVWKTLLGKLKVSGEIIRAGRDPMFGGVSPEPVEKNLAPLAEAVKRRGALLGIAVDGDADRLGVIDEKGDYLAPHTVFPLILRHLVENRKLGGAVVQAVSLGYVSERMAKHFKLPFVEVPVGFKNVADQISQRKVLWGGEESGGYGVGLWGSERDGILSGLLLTELVLATGKPLSVLRQEMADQFGASAFTRLDLTLRAPVADKTAWADAITKRLPAKLAGTPIKETRNVDGLKIILADDSWVLLRPSGTEPLMRAYAESPKAAVTQQLLNKAQEWAGARNNA